MAISGKGISAIDALDSISGASTTDATITASDKILFQDVDDSDNVKSDTVQGILDLVGGGSGGLTLLSEQIISTAVTSLTFSGLDGNTDGFYFLFIEKDNSVACSWNLHVNGNTTVSNYYCQSALFDSTTLTGVRLNASNVAYSGTSHGSVSSVFVSKSNNNYMTYISYHGRNLGGTTPAMQNFTGCSNFTITNITSITLTADASNGIGVGSKIRLYKGV